MKKFPFLLLDAGPIIKIFSLNKWDEFIKHCDITISRTIAYGQALYTEDGSKQINLKPYEEKSLIKIIDVDSHIVAPFYDKFSPLYKSIIHEGEVETLAFLYDSKENWRICSADKAVFNVVGILGKASSGISLEEILRDIGLGPILGWKNITPRDKDWKYTKKFREMWTRKGQIDSVQGMGLAE